MKQHCKRNESNLDSKSIYSSRESLYKDDESEFTSSSTDQEASVQRKVPQRKDEDNEINNEDCTNTLIKFENGYQKKLAQGKKNLGENVVSYQALPREMKDEVDLYVQNQEDFRDIGWLN